MRGMDLILAENIMVKLVILPENHDPDSFMKEVGPSEFLKFVEDNEKDFILYKTQLLLEETSGDPVKRAYILKDIVATLAKVGDPLIRSMYVKECSSILDVDEKIIVSATNKIIKKEIKDKIQKRHRELSKDAPLEVVDESTEVVAPSQSLLVRSDEYQERAVVKVLMEKGHLYFDTEEQLLVVDFIIMNIVDTLDYFENKTYKKIIHLAMKQRETGDIPNELFYTNNEDSEVRKLYVELVMNPYDYADWSSRGMELQTQKPPDKNHVEETKQAVMRLNYKKLNKIIKENNKKMSEQDTSSEEYITLLKLHQKLLEEKKKMAGQLNIVVQ